MSSTKIDFKKEYKELYSAKNNEFSIIEVPKLKFLSIEGIGHPSESEFQNAVGILYKMAYTIKMMPKKGTIPEGYIEHVVSPLECIYWLLDNSKRFGWKAMLAQPNFVNKSVLNKAADILKSKDKNLKISKINLENFSDGKSIQTLYIGSYDKIGEMSKRIDEYLEKNNLVKNGNWHEIYLSDPRKIIPEKLKTIIRIPIKGN